MLNKVGIVELRKSVQILTLQNSTSKYRLV